MISCVFLALTLLVYTFVPLKSGKNAYSSLMKNFTGSLLFAFIILFMNQNKDYTDFPSLCAFFGNFENHFTFRFIIVILFRICYAVLSSCGFYIHVLHELWNLPSNEVSNFLEDFFGSLTLRPRKSPRKSCYFAVIWRLYSVEYSYINVSSFRGHLSSKKRFWIEVVVGYCIPGFITICTYLTQILATCSMFDPKIADKSCFFSGTTYL